MLRFVEEITLLQLHDDDGRFARVPSWSLNYALAGGVLMDLAMENRIDTDLEDLILVDATPTGDSLLDPTLADIAAGEKHDARFWVEQTAERAEAIQEEALSRLIALGILERQEDRFPLGLPVQTLPNDRRAGRARGQAPHHGRALQRRNPRPPRRRHHLPRRRLRHLQGNPLQAGVGTSLRPHRAGPQARPSSAQAMSQAIQDIELSVAASVQGHYLY